MYYDRCTSNRFTDKSKNLRSILRYVTLWTPCIWGKHRRLDFHEGWKMMDLPRRPETLWSQFHGGCREREVMAFARAKVAFFPESEKMTRKAGRSCVKIKRPVFLPWALSRITTLAKNFRADYYFKKKNRTRRQRTYVPRTMTFGYRSFKR